MNEPEHDPFRRITRCTAARTDKPKQSVDSTAMKHHSCKFTRILAAAGCSAILLSLASPAFASGGSSTAARPSGPDGAPPAKGGTPVPPSLPAAGGTAGAESDYSAPPVVPQDKSSRPPLKRTQAVNNFRMDAAIRKNLDLALENIRKRSDEKVQEAMAAVQAARGAPIATAAPLFTTAAGKCKAAMESTRSNALRISLAECYRNSTLENCYDLARAQLLLVLQDPDVDTADVAGAASELRELALIPGYKLTVSPDEVAGFGREVGKIFGDSVSAGSLDLGSVMLPYNAGELFRANGDSVWAAQMYRKCLNAPPGKRVDPHQIKAQQALATMKLPPLPPFPETREVSTKYLYAKGIEKPSTEYLEEYAPQVNVWKCIKDAVLEAHFDKPGKIKFVTDQDVANFKTSMTGHLGADFPAYRSLYLQTICYIVVKKFNCTYPNAAKYCKTSLMKALTQPVTVAELPDNGAETDLQWVDSFKNQMRVAYLKSDAEREEYRLTASGGNLMQGGKLFDTKDMSTAFSGKGWAIYVVSPDGGVYSGTHKVSAFHHSSLLAAADAAGAGELKVTGGRIVAISNKSGHYWPGAKHLVQSLDALKKMGADLTALDQVLVMGVGTGIQQWKGNAGAFRKAWDNPAEFKKEFAALGFTNDPTQ